MNKKPAPVNAKNPAKGQPQQPKVPKVWKADDYVTPNVILEQILELKEAFDIFDVNKNGIIDPVELKNAFISLGFGGQNKFVLRILHDYDTDGNQGIDFGEFIKLSTARFGQSVTKADVERVFKHFDLNKSGKISAADMKKVAEELNENLTDEEIEKMVLKADSDEDGLLTSDDFYSVLVNMSTQYE